MIKITTVSILKFSENMFYMDTWMDRQELEIWLEQELRESEKMGNQDREKWNTLCTYLP